MKKRKNPYWTLGLVGQAKMHQELSHHPIGPAEAALLRPARVLEVLVHIHRGRAQVVGVKERPVALQTARHGGHEFQRQTTRVSLEIVAQQPHHCEVLQWRAAKGRIPLAATRDRARDHPSSLFEQGQRSLHSMSLFWGGDAGPQRVERGGEGIAATLLRHIVVVEVHPYKTRKYENRLDIRNPICVDLLLRPRGIC